MDLPVHIDVQRPPQFLISLKKNTYKYQHFYGKVWKSWRNEPVTFCKNRMISFQLFSLSRSSQRIIVFLFGGQLTLSSDFWPLKSVWCHESTILLTSWISHI